jgi:hypothetical protein
MVSKHSKVVGGILAAMLAACGSEGSSTDDANKPEFVSIRGELRGSVSLSELTNSSIGVLWLEFDEPSDEPAFAQEVVALFGGDDTEFVLPILEGPGNINFEIDLDDDGVVDASFAYGFLIGFEDVDGDGTVPVNHEGFDSPDRAFGFAADQSLLYVEMMDEQVASMLFSNPEAVTLGVNLIRFVACGGPPTIEPLSTPIVLHTFEPSEDVDGLLVGEECEESTDE